jgi:type II secretory pathway component PulM
MITFESIQDYIASLQEKEILRGIAAYFLLFGMLVGFLLYRHNSALADAQQKTRLLNKARQQVQTMLTEYDTIKNKKAEVDEKLTKDKNFYLVKFYQDTIAAVKITSQNNPNLVSGTGPAGYSEESLQVNFTQITMQKLCEFLQALQATPRVTVKNLEISKGNVEKKINVSMSLATLKPTVDKINSTK